MPKICVFGLSGNPPTGRLGHQGIVKILVDTKKFDEIWVLPVYRHIFSKKFKLASFEHRVNMCQKSLEKLSSEACKVVVKTTEKTVCEHRIKENPENLTGTADILEDLIAANPKAKFSFAMGGDTYSDLVGGKWRRAADLAKMVKGGFEVFARSSSPDLEALIATENAKEPSVHPFTATLHHLPISKEGLEVSSTNVREELEDIVKGSEIDKDSDLFNPDVIDPEVLAYCRANGIFEASSEAPKAKKGGWAVLYVPVFILFLAFAAGAGLRNSGVDLVEQLKAHFGDSLSFLEPYLPSALDRSSNALATVPHINADNFAAMSEGKTVFLKMYAPWCGHCKALAPTWSKVAALVNTPESHVLVASVDCTEDVNKAMCEDLEGYPTLLWGDSASGVTPYEGKRDFSALLKFAKELKKPCDLNKLETCEASDQEKIKGYLELGSENLQKLIEENTNASKSASAQFDEGVKELQEKFSEMKEKHEKELQTIKDSGLGLMKSVLASNKKRSV